MSYSGGLIYYPVRYSLDYKCLLYRRSKRYLDELVAYLKRHGRKKVMFGTHYPMITADTCTEQIKQLELDEEIQALFLHGNAERGFCLNQDASL